MGAQGPPDEVWAALDRIEFDAGAVVGILSHLGAYLAVLGLVLTVEDEYVSEGLLTESGQLLYNAMFVEMERPLPGGGVSSDAFDSSYNVLLSEDFAAVFTVPTIIYHAIPVLALLAGGVALAWVTDARGLKNGAITGVSLAVGGLLFAITGTLVFDNALGTPAFGQSLLLVGILYPAVCGSIGGAIGGLLRA